MAIMRERPQDNLPPQMMQQLPPNVMPQEEIPIEPQQAVQPEFIDVEAEVLRFKTSIDQLNAQQEMTNIADTLDKQKLDEIAEKISANYDIDKTSREEWEKKNKELFKLAKLIVDKKMIGDEPVANIKFPLITNAAIQFNARAYPQIVKGQDIVKAVVVGEDESGKKADRGKRITDHMSYQLLYDMPCWEEDVDQMLVTLPILGCAFKKTYYADSLQQNVSEMIFPKDLIVDYYAKSIEEARRITHVIKLTKNDVVERIRSDVFTDIDVDSLVNSSYQETDEHTYGIDDDDAYIELLEQHCWLDLDGDGYQEPYVIVVHEETRQTLRISARYDAEGIMTNERGEIVKINPVHYFTRFLFMPSFDGGFYGQGFGTLLQPHNEMINSIMNQLLDAGKLANKQIGFISSRARIAKNTGKNNEIKFLGGELKSVDATGTALRDSIYFMPIKEPSGVLFSLLGMLIDSGKELASISDVLSGESPGPNVPATTTLALIEQGMKVFTGIYKRIHRSLKEEFKKIRRLNRLYLDPQRYNNVIDRQELYITREDYSSEDCDIFPVSDPTNANDTTRYLKAQALIQLIGQGLNDDAIKKRYLESLQIENIEELLPPEAEDGQPGPAEQMQMQKMQLELQQAQVEIQQAQAEIQKIVAETQLIMQKAKSEQVTHGVKAAGVSFDEEKLAIQRAQTTSNIQAQRTQEQRDREKTVTEREKALMTFAKDANKSAEQKKQGPYVERGLQSNNKEV